MSDLNDTPSGMSSVPLLTVDTKKITHNVAELVRLAHTQGITVTGTTKGCWGHRAVAEAIVAGGADYLSDSRVQNLMKSADLPLPKMMLRLPMSRQAADVVRYADYSLVSEPGIIDRLNTEATAQNRRHGVLVMVDIGDLREGIWMERRADIFSACEAALRQSHVELAGLGTNLTCYGGVIPTVENYTALLEIVAEVRRRYSVELPIISGGNSSCINLLRSGNWPSGINNIRINQSVFIGRELAEGALIPGWHSDIFTLHAEVAEVQMKPSYPIGEIAKMNAFGAPPADIPDRGMRLRAILCIGRQDMDVSSLVPCEAGGFFQGASSDHTIIDVTDCANPPHPGDVMALRVDTYRGILSAMASEWIEKRPIF